MSATVLGSWSEWRAKTRDLEKQSMLRVGTVTKARRDVKDLERSYFTVKKRRAFPEGTPPAELWTMPLHASRNLSPAGQGVGYQTKKVEPTGLLAPVERLLCRVRSSGTAPLAWHHSSGVNLHKSNKPGPKGRRVVHVLPSMGKQFLNVPMRRKPNGGGWSQPEPADWLHGCIPAVLIRQVTTWRLERLGSSHSRPFTI